MEVRTAVIAYMHTPETSCMLLLLVIAFPPALCFTRQAEGVGGLLHDSLRAFLKSNSHSLKRHVWSTAGSAAALEAWTGTAATMQVSYRGGPWLVFGGSLTLACI